MTHSLSFISILTQHLFISDCLVIHHWVALCVVVFKLCKNVLWPLKCEGSGVHWSKVPILKAAPHLINLSFIFPGEWSVLTAVGECHVCLSSALTIVCCPGVTTSTGITVSAAVTGLQVPVKHGVSLSPLSQEAVCPQVCSTPLLNVSPLPPPTTPQVVFSRWPILSLSGVLIYLLRTYSVSVGPYNPLNCLLWCNQSSCVNWWWYVSLL